MDRRHRAHHYLLLLSMPLCLNAGEARAQTIADLAQHTSEGTTHAARRTGAQALESDTAVRPADRSGRSKGISDDGNGNEVLPSTTQLIISTSDRLEGSMILDILDDQGRQVQRHLLVCTAGQRVWPIDVDELRRGRYIARLTNGNGATVSRFRCE